MIVTERRPSREQLKEWHAVLKLRHFVDRNDPSLYGTKKLVFDSLFPPVPFNEMRKSLFHIETVSQHKEVEYTDQEKAFTREILAEFGWSKSYGEDDVRKKGVKVGRFDMPHLYIAYNDNPEAITTHLNRLEFMKRQDALGMTEPTLQQKEGGPYKMTRGQHVRHMASFMFRDILRAAIKQPKNLLDRIFADMKRYGYTTEQVHELLGGKNNHLISLSQKRADIQITREQYNALDLALEYAKYLTIFAYIHDERTPAWGDAIMKARARFKEGQSDVAYSEDAKLAEDIDTMIGLNGTTGSDTGLTGVVDFFKLDKVFLSRIVKSLSSESDSCLGGILMKNKRKPPFEQNNPNLARALRQIGAVYKEPGAEIRGDEKLGAVLDEDQTSGTISNLYDIATQILPGGMHYIPKLLGGTVPDEQKTPYGTFYDRLSLLAYALATGKSKQDIVDYCTQKGIDPERVFIARDEFHIGANFELQAVPELGGEILPVGIDPGSIKRLMYAFATVTYFHYQSDNRSGQERLMQDVITSIHDYQLAHIRSHQDQHLGSPSETQILSMFLNTTDEGAAQSLESSIPLIPYIKNYLLPQFSRVTTDEVATRIEDIRQRGNYFMITEAPMFPVDTKAGTLTKQDGGGVAGYLEVIGKKRGEDVLNPDSLTMLLHNTEIAMKSSRFYHILELTPDQVEIMKQKISYTHSPKMQEIQKRALRYWTLDLPIGDNVIADTRLRQEFLLEGEDPHLPLKEQSNVNTELQYLAYAERQVNTVK